MRPGRIITIMRWRLRVPVPSRVRAIFRQFVRFAGVGFVSAVGHYGLLIACVQAFAVDAVLSSAAGALLGAAINYTLNYHFTFQSDKSHREAIGKFLAVAAIGLALNTLFMWIGVDILGGHYLLAQLVTTALVVVWSFIGNRWWTFRQQPLVKAGRGLP